MRHHYAARTAYGLDADTADWRDRAACRDEDTELFFPLGTASEAAIAMAKAVCRRCPVRDECLTWALESGEEHGIWGGLTENERRAAGATPARHHHRPPTVIDRWYPYRHSSLPVTEIARRIGVTGPTLQEAIRRARLAGDDRVPPARKRRAAA